jgi:hypothetical protein
VANQPGNLSLGFGDHDIAIFMNTMRVCNGRVPRRCRTDSDGQRKCSDDWKSCPQVDLGSSVCPDLIDAIKAPKPKLKLGAWFFGINILWSFLAIVLSFFTKWSAATEMMLIAYPIRVLKIIFACVGCYGASGAYGPLKNIVAIECTTFGGILGKLQYEFSSGPNLRAVSLKDLGFSASSSNLALAAVVIGALVVVQTLFNLAIQVLIQVHEGAFFRRRKSSSAAGHQSSDHGDVYSPRQELDVFGHRNNDHQQQRSHDLYFGPSTLDSGGGLTVVQPPPPLGGFDSLHRRDEPVLGIEVTHPTGGASEKLGSDHARYSGNHSILPGPSQDNHVAPGPPSSLY